MNASNETDLFELPVDEVGLSLSAEAQLVQRTMLYVSYFAVPTFLLLGVLGNSLTVVVMRSKTFRQQTTSYVLTALALSDTALNLMVPFNKGFFRELLTIDIRALSNFGCNIFFWAWRTAKMTSSWLVVLISVERIIAVCMPMRAATLNTKRNVIIAIVSIYMAIGSFNLVWSLLMDRRIGGVCLPNTAPPGLEHVASIFIIVGTSLYALLPSALLIVGTQVIIIGLHRAQRLRARLSVNSREQLTDPTAKTTAMLLAVCVAFVLLVLPIGLAHLTSFFASHAIFESTDIGFVIFREVAQVLEQLNYSINFLLYVTASASFRSRMLSIICHNLRSSNDTIMKRSHSTRTNSGKKETSLNSSNKQPDTPSCLKGEVEKGTRYDQSETPKF